MADPVLIALFVLLFLVISQLIRAIGVIVDRTNEGDPR